jgi:HEAT repeat protein
VAVVALLGLWLFSPSPVVGADEEDAVVQMVVDLLQDKDPDMRALGLQQVREAAKGEAATKRFTAVLPQLSPDARAALINALADRGDKTACAAVLEMLNSNEEPVREASLRALGSLGDASQTSGLVKALSSASNAEQKAAEQSLTRLIADGVNAAIVAEMKQATPAIRVKLLGVLETRRATDCFPAVLEAALDSNMGTRMAAMAMLRQLGGPEQVAGMLRGVLKANPGSERESAEKAVMFVCSRIADVDKRSDSILTAWKGFSKEEQTTLLTTLGRVGGPAVLKVVESAIADQDPKQHDAGMVALCNWPDASVAPRLLELAETAPNADERLAAFRALIRVAALPDHRSEAERLDLLQKAMEMATREEERNLILKRAKAVRTVETLRFVFPYLSQPELAQEACATVVELAHHRKLRDSNKAEFDKALDAVIEICKDPSTVDRAKRYKKGQT